MQKSRKNNIKKKRQFSRRKRGGMIDDGGYILVGFHNSTSYALPVPPLPLFLEKNKKGHGYEFMEKLIPNTKYSSSILILPQLYKTKYRNIDFWVLSNARKVFYQDSSYNKILDGPGYISWPEDKLKYIEENKDKIRQMELEYPGLFERIVISEEEESQALNEKQRAQLPTEADSATTQTPSQEEMQFMEMTDQMIPYLRNDMKTNKKKKTRKRIQDTNVTLGIAR